MECPACGTMSGDVCMALEDVPALCNVLCASEEEALAAPRGRVELSVCARCGLVFNRAFDPLNVVYEGTYENALHFSGRFRTFASELARELGDRYALKGKHVAEVGCGDGHFLAALCLHTGARGSGFDPAHDPARSAVPPGADVIVQRGYFDPVATEPADLLVCRHVLEHIASPVEFLTRMHSAMPEGGAAYFEVPCGDWIVEAGSGWDVIYEHCNYFTPRSLENAFRLAGFEPLRVQRRYDNQFLSIEARAGTGATAPLAPPDLTEEDVSRFAARQLAQIGAWNDRLEKWRPERVVLWGAGSKGVMFLSSVPAARRIGAVCDVSPRKRGKYIVGTRHRMGAPEDLASRDTGVVILANPIYRDEVAAQLAAMNVNAELVTL